MTSLRKAFGQAVFFAGALCLSQALGAQLQVIDPRSMIRLQQAGGKSAEASIADLSWLTGTWVGDMEGMSVEHVILPPRFDQIPGFVRAAGAAEIVFYEITKFEQVGNSVSYRVKHFTPALTGWEAQNAYVDRPLVERSADSLFFDGITFTRTGADSFTVYFYDRERNRTLVIPFKRSSPTAA